MAIKYYDSLNVTSTTDSYFLGEVGIGTATPSYKLDVRGPVRIISGDENTLYLDTEDAGQQVAIYYRENGTSRWEQRVSSNFELYNYTTSSWDFHIQGSTGNVGIGTTSPGYKLHNTGTSRLEGRVTLGGNVNNFIEGLAGSIDFKSAGNFNFIKGANTLLTILETGSVGIGTTVPNQKLGVNGNINIAGGDGSYLTFNNGDANIKIHNNNVTVDGRDLGFETWKAGVGLSEKMRITRDGKVKFNLYGSGTNTGTLAYKLGVDSSGNVIETAVGAGAVDGSGTANYVTKWTDADTIGNSVIYDNGTNVGIGTTSPTSPLDVRRSDASGKVAEFHNNAGFGIDIDVESDGGVNTIASGSNQSLAFVTNGGTNERMRINIAGNVGIGTTSPARLLSVNGIQGWSASGTEKAAINPTSTGTDFTLVGDNGNIRFDSRPSGNSYVGTGNFGIGTTSPAHTLDVKGADTNDATIARFYSNIGTRGSFVIKNGTTTNPTTFIGTAGGGEQLSIGTNSTESIRIDGSQNATFAGDVSVEDNLYLTDAGTTRAKIQLNSSDRDDLDIIAVSLGSNMKFFTVDAERMRIDANGNIGIGTTSPGAKLQIGSATYAPNSNLGNNLLQIKSASGYAYLTIGNGDAANSTSYIGGASGFTVIGSVADAGTLSEHMRITNTGNVGIGTTSPSEKLEVDGIIKAVHTDDSYATYRGNGVFFNRTDSYLAPLTDNTATLNIGYALGRWGNVEINGSIIKFENGANERMRIDGSGNVGIGTTSPSEKLEVVGNVKLGDSNKLLLGTSSDLIIEHTGSFSRIQENGPGSLYLQGENLIFTDSSGTDTYAVFTHNAGVSFRYDNAVKLETTSTGVTVTGTVNLTNLTVSGAQGTDGQVLTSTGSGVAWEDAGGGSGTVTEVVAGTGLTGGTITTSGTVALDYAGNDNFILGSGTQLTSAADGDVLAIVDIDDARNVKYIEKSDFLEDQVTSDISEGGSGSVVIGNMVKISQTDYGNLGVPDADTLYFIVG